MAKFSVKKGIAVIAALLLTGTAAITAYAFLGIKPEEKVNTFRVGEQLETVKETFTEPTVQRTADTITKVVKVENTGSVPCFVRVFLDFSDSGIRDKALIVTSENSEGAAWSDFLARLPENWEYVSETDATDGGTLGGYFYYTQILAPNDSTSSLIEGIKTQFQNVYDIADFDIIVYSESVQTVEINSSGTEYSAAQWKEAWSSFLTRTTP